VNKLYCLDFRRRCQGYLLAKRWKLLQKISRIIAPRRSVHSRGLHFTLPCNNWITHYRWKTFNTKEPETLDWIDNHIKEEDVFFDVGANIGIYSVYAALRQRKIQVIAFEPEYANLHLLRDNVVENNLRDRIKTYAVALSNRVGFSTLHIQDLNPGAALSTESREDIVVTRENCPVIWKEGICTFTLDMFCQETGLQPNCMKLDVDGNEKEILEGGIATVSSPHFRTLIFELSDKKEIQDSCSKILGEAGLKRCYRSDQNRTEIWSR